MKLAAIDIGTNSIHLLVVDVGSDGSVNPVEKSRVQAELGAGGLDAETLAPEAFQRGVDTLVQFRETCDSFNVEHIACAATSAVREAANGKAFCNEVKARTNIHVRVIAGVEEARLIYLGARQDLDFSRGRVLLFDVGGGSTEVILCDAENILASQSLRLGHIRLAEGWHHSDPMTADEQKAIRKTIRKRTKSFRHRVGPDDLGMIVGTSGTVRALARMEAMANGQDYPEHQHGMVITAQGLDALVEQLTTLSEQDRAALPGMDDRRVRTLPAGAVLVQEVMRAMGKDHIVTSNRSLRDGLIVDWMEKHRPRVALSRQLADPRQRSVRATMDRYGVDAGHVEHIAEMARALFDATASKHRLRVDDRRLLTFGTLLHDCGHHISGRRHDKRGAYLIRHTHMPGFTAPEVAILERMVRYHSGKKPKKKHKRYAALSRPDRRRVRILSGILCLADAFDRGHHQNVTDFQADLSRGVLTIDATTANPPDLARWTTQRRKRRIEKALGIDVEVRFHYEGPDGSDVPADDTSGSSD